MTFLHLLHLQPPTYIHVKTVRSKTRVSMIEHMCVHSRHYGCGDVTCERQRTIMCDLVLERGELTGDMVKLKSTTMMG
jgi:hypothetical protein